MSRKYKWLIVRYRGTGAVGKYGRKLFLATLRTDTGPLEYMERVVFFFSANAAKRLREACAKMLTQDGLDRFLNSEPLGRRAEMAKENS